MSQTYLVIMKEAPEARVALRFAARRAAMKRKEDLHKMAESNKAFAHYRW